MKLPVRLLTALLLCALGASADLVTLKDGRVLEGKVVEDDGKVLKLKMRKGTMALDRKDIASVEQKATPEEEYQERLKKLDDKSASAQLDLARWAGTKDLDAEALRHLFAAWKLDEKLEGIADEFGKHDYHFRDKRWEDPDTYYPAIGWVKFDGRWCSPKEVEYRKALKEVSARGAARDAAKSALAAAKDKARKIEARASAEKAAMDKSGAGRDKADAALAACEGRFKIAQDKAVAAAEKLKAAQDKDKPKEGEAQKGSSPAVKDAEKKLADANAAVAKESKSMSAASQVVSDLVAEKAAAGKRLDAIGKEAAAADKEVATLEDDLASAQASIDEAAKTADQAKADWESSK